MTRSTTSDWLAELVDQLPGSLAVAADLALPDDRERVVAAAVDRFGAIDVLVNNAGIGHKVAVEDETLDDFRATMELDAALLFLAGPGSTFFTGQSVIVDGGWTAR